MKKVWIEPGCIACGSCQFTAPDVFEVTDKSRIKATASLEEQKELIKLAAARCPVLIIKFEEKA